jgi:hypothetical protein
LVDGSGSSCNKTSHSCRKLLEQESCMWTFVGVEGGELPAILAVSAKLRVVPSGLVARHLLGRKQVRGLKSWCGL